MSARPQHGSTQDKAVPATDCRTGPARDTEAGVSEEPGFRDADHRGIHIGVVALSYEPEVDFPDRLVATVTKKGRRD